MSRRKALFGLLIVAAVGAAAYGRFGNNIQGALEEFSGQTGAVADIAKRFSSIAEMTEWFPPLKWIVGEKATPQQAPRPQRTVAVEVATAVQKKTPVLIEGLGNVTTMANVAVRPRIDNEIVGVHFADGAYVKKGDLLITLDGRAGRRKSRQGSSAARRR